MATWSPDDPQPQTREEVQQALEQGFARVFELLRLQGRLLGGGNVPESERDSTTGGISAKNVNRRVWRQFVALAMLDGADVGELLTSVLTDYIERRKKEDAAA